MCVCVSVCVCADFRFSSWLLCRVPGRAARSFGLHSELPTSTITSGFKGSECLVAQSRQDPLPLPSLALDKTNEIAT